MTLSQLKLIGGLSHPTLAVGVARELDRALESVAITSFPNSETSVRLELSLTGSDTYLIQSLSAPTNDRLVELLLLADAARRAGAVRITAVIPSVGYSRQDRVSQLGEPLSAQLVARLLAAAQIDQVITVDVHSPAFAEFCTLAQVAVTELSAIPLLADVILHMHLSDLQIVSPDQGGIARAEAFAHRLTPGRPPLVIPKKRLDHETVTMDEIIGQVRGTMLLVDDVLSTGGTICEAARLLKRAGAEAIWVAVTHGEFIGAARAKLEAAPISGILTTDSLPTRQREIPKSTRRLSLAPLLTDEIRRSHQRFSEGR